MRALFWSKLMMMREKLEIFDEKKSENGTSQCHHF